MTWYRYRAHGLTVASEVELPLATAVGPAAGPAVEPDLAVRVGGVIAAEDGPAEGEVLAELVRDGRTSYRFTRHGDRVLLRYPGLCEVEGDATLGRVTAWVHAGADPGVLSVLAGGSLLALHLMLRGHLVLHASAVRHDDRVLAFVGASGMGKSTLAAAYCAAGAALVTDDVLRVDLAAGHGATVHPGATENRLRPAAERALDEGAAGAARRTADGRLAVRQHHDVDDSLPLHACIVPMITGGPGELAVRRLPPGEALRSLIRFPRFTGWIEQTVSAATFQGLGALVERVPVFEAILPRGLPVPASVLAGLLAAVTGQLDPARPVLATAAADLLAVGGTLES